MREPNQHHDSFSSAERLFLDVYRKTAQALLSPVVRFLVYLNVSPNLISLMQILGGVVIFYLIAPYPRVALVVFLMTLLLDTLDGALARSSGRSSPFGALVDQFSDHAREAIVIAGLATAGALSPAPAVLYVFVYITFNLTLFLCNYNTVALPLVLKSYLLVYPAIFLYLWFGQNWLDPAVTLSIGLMAAFVALGFWRLSGALR